MRFKSILELLVTLRCLTDTNCMAGRREITYHIYSGVIQTCFVRLLRTVLLYGSYTKRRNGNRNSSDKSL